MEKTAWDKKYNIGVEIVDNAHAKLFRILQKLFDLSQDTNTYQTSYREGIKYLEAYSMTHFSEEEAYMRSIHYSGYAAHKRIHDNFRDKTLVSLKRDLELSKYSSLAVQRFVGIMNSWLTEHIMREDQAIVGKAAPHRERSLSGQIPLLSKAVNRATQDILQLEAKLSDADYKGQNIGEGFYCYQCYSMEGGIRLQLLLGAETALLLRGVHRICGVRTAQKEEMTNDDLLRVFGQLMQSTGKVFQTESADEFNKNNLLTRDGFRTEFMKGYPCSLLFGTKAGYFIFCYRYWRENGKK